MDYGEGSIYEGQMKNNRRHGMGKLTRTVEEVRPDDPERYHVEIEKGNWVNDELDGFGLAVIYRETYVGDFRNGLFEGKGLLVEKSGEYLYEGEFLKDKFHGHGTIQYRSGIVYTGQFVDGRKHGWGVKYDPVIECSLTGEYRDDVPHGRGTIVYGQSGLSFDGHFENGKMVRGNPRILGISDAHDGGILLDKTGLLLISELIIHIDNQKLLGKSNIRITLDGLSSRAMRLILPEYRSSVLPVDPPSSLQSSSSSLSSSAASSSSSTSSTSLKKDEAEPRYSLRSATKRKESTSTTAETLSEKKKQKTEETVDEQQPIDISSKFAILESMKQQLKLLAAESAKKHTFKSYRRDFYLLEYGKLVACLYDDETCLFVISLSGDRPFAPTVYCQWPDGRRLVGLLAEKQQPNQLSEQSQEQQQEQLSQIQMPTVEQLKKMKPPTLVTLCGIMEFPNKDSMYGKWLFTQESPEMLDYLSNGVENEMRMTYASNGATAVGSWTNNQFFVDHYVEVVRKPSATKQNKQQTKQNNSKTSKK